MVNIKILVKSSWWKRHFKTHQKEEHAKLYRCKDEDKGRKQTIYSVKKKSSQLQIGLVTQYSTELQQPVLRKNTWADEQL
jgi:hypothetical protein